MMSSVTANNSSASHTVIERDVIKLSGELTNATVVDIDAGGKTRIAQAGDQVRVDLTAVTRVDSSALALLLGWQRYARGLKKQILLQAVPANLASIMQLTGADNLFAVEHG